MNDEPPDLQRHDESHFAWLLRIQGGLSSLSTAELEALTREAHAARVERHKSSFRRTIARNNTRPLALAVGINVGMLIVSAILTSAQTRDMELMQECSAIAQECLTKAADILLEDANGQP